MRLPFSIPPVETADFDIVGLGQNSVDLLAVVDGYPASNGKHRLRGFSQLPGGQIATAVAVCRRLGWRARYIGSFGDDPMGRMSRESLVGEGVDLGGSRIVEGATNQFAIIIVDACSGARTILWNRHPALAMEASLVPKAAVTAGRLLLVDGDDTEASAEAVRAARAAGVPTLVDVERVGPGIHELLTAIDAIIAAQSFPEELTGCAQPGRALEAMAREFDAPLVCVTLGEGGSLARCGGRDLFTPAFKVDCVDSTGAGDAFHGGFAAGCLRRSGGDLEDVLMYASAVAALNCRALGARASMPTADEVEQLLRARGVH